MHIIDTTNANTRDEFMPAINHTTKTATYLVGPVEAHDLTPLDGRYRWNEFFADELVQDGYLLQDITFELVAHATAQTETPKVYVKVHAEAGSWLENDG